MYNILMMLTFVLVQVNHLSPLLLTLELLPVVLETASGSGDGRIVFMSSKAHEYATWNPETMNAPDEQHYDRIKVYGVTKLYNVSRESQNN